MSENHSYDDRITVLVEELRCIFTCISDEQRIEIVKNVMAGYCRDCGIELLGRTCHCKNDE